MKFCLLLSVFIFTAFSSFSQVSVGDVDINKDENIKIIEVLVSNRFASKSINVFVDFGQKSNFRAGTLNNKTFDQRITDPKTRKELTFTSTSALLNYLQSNNWEHYDSVILPDKSGEAFYYYLRKKL